MDGQIKGSWFSENCDLWPGQRLSLQVKQVLHAEKSDYQDILVLQTTNHGRALILDGIIQCTEVDEFAYQEMIAFLPLCVHPCPNSVLVVGGGDGGVVREVAKHPLVERITQVEIDGRVIEASKKYLPFMAKGFESPKLDLHVCDGFQFIKEHMGEFDVIITDSSDPVGPAVNLFTESYFKMLKGALKSGGIICSQGGTTWVGLDHVQQTLAHCKRHFPVVRYATASVPTYPTGQIGFVVASLDDKNKLTLPTYKFSLDELNEKHIKYYNDEVHTASFVLPNFVRKVLSQQ